MKKNPDSQSGSINLRVLFAAALCSVGVFLAALGFAAPPTTPLAPTGPGWSIISSPNTSATQQNFLYGVTCISPSDCWGVGKYETSSVVAQTLIEHWDGTSWSIVPSPNTSATQSNYLFKVACTSSANCWAAGYYYTGSNVAQTLIERWNGSSWSIVPSNNSSPSQNNYLFDVTCASASQCWAVGSYFNGTSTQTLIERWDGTSWASASSPSIAGYLYSVTCTSASQCWSVGFYSLNGHPQTLVERWDGTSWASVPSANSNGSSTQDNYLTGVTCASASDCWAVGYYDPTNTGDVGLPIIERLNPPSNSWSIFPSPNIGITYLTGVTCTSTSDCWAVGYGIDSDASPPTYYTLSEHWDGSSWQFVIPPNKPHDNFLSSVACPSASQCWSVGYASYYQNGPHSQTLIEEYSPTIPPLVGVVSRKVHGSAGTFDIDLPLTGARGVECRSPGATGTPGVDYKIVFTFVNNLTSCGTADTGSLSSGPGSNQCTVDLTGVANQQYITVTLNNVLDSQNNTGIVAGTMGVLIGDATGNGIVSNSGDVNSVKAQVSATVTSSNFRNDINANGVISNSGDVAITKTKVSTQLSPLP